MIIVTDRVFVNWPDLQRTSRSLFLILLVFFQEDFVPVLAEKMSNKWATGVNIFM